MKQLLMTTFATVFASKINRVGKLARGVVLIAALVVVSAAVNAAETGTPSAMGFYPFNPCGGEYIIGAPQVPEARIRLGERNRLLWVGATHGEATKPSEASAEGTGDGERVTGKG